MVAAIEEKLTCLWEERRAKRSRWRDYAEDFRTLVGTCRLPLCDWWIRSAPDTSSGKTCPVFCRATEDGTLAPLSGRWLNSGMGGPTESWTLSTSEFPSDAVVCSLSDVLEDSDVVPEAYYLTRTACRGILRRAEKRGRKLPETLQRALTAAATKEDSGQSQESI